MFSVILPSLTRTKHKLVTRLGCVTGSYFCRSVSEMESAVESLDLLLKEKLIPNIIGKSVSE